MQSLAWRHWAWRPLLVSVVAAIVHAQSDRTDLTLVSRIKAEAFENSKVMDTLSYLTDVYGPRLAASPEYNEAADWVVKRLRSYGVENVHLEKWGPFGRSWGLKQYSVEMLEPRYAALDAVPLAWSDTTRGPTTGEVVYAPYGSARQSLDPKKQQQDLDQYMAAWKGKLKGKIVLMTRARELTPARAPTFNRFSDKDLSDRVQAPAPFARLSDIEKLEIPEDPVEEQKLFGSLPPGILDQLAEQRRRIAAARAKFLHDEGVLGVLNTNGSSVNGLVFATAAGPHNAKDTLAPPTFAVSREQYNRMVRLWEKKLVAKVRLNLQAEISQGNVDTSNVIGEIPGGAKKEEVVMIGAHLDSWHSGTGATDNASGSAVMIEAMRILKALNLKLDRTVRIALWSGEEQGLLGSEAYVKEHFGDPETMRLTSAHSKLAGYFNVDNGTGRIRGVYLQGNDAMRPVFEQWFAPFRDQGVGTVSIRSTGGTDHLSFDTLGLPGFQFIQDPIEYDTLTHHSQMDTYDHIQAADMMQNAQIIATLVYNAANRSELLPRKPLPKPAIKLKSLEMKSTGTASAGAR